VSFFLSILASELRKNSNEGKALDSERVSGRV